MANNSLEQLSLHTIGGGWGAEIADTTNNIRVSVIRGTDIPRLRVGDFSSVPVRYESAAKVKSRLLKPGDIVVEVSGGSAASGQHTGRALLITQQMVESLGGNVIPASFCRLLRLDSRRVNSRFIVYQIDALHLSGEISEFENQSTGIANFQFTRFIQETYPCIEDLQTQSAIAHILGTLDDKIELLRRQNETLEAMARALFKAWFVDFAPVRAKMEGRWQRGQSLPGLPAHLYDLFPDRLVDSELGEIPEGWRHSTIGEEVTVCGGSTPSTKEPEFWEGGRHCWATPKDLSALKFPVLLDTDRKITDAGLAKISSGLLPVGTVLLSSRAPIGYLAIAEVPTAINQGFIAMKCDGALPNVFVLPWCRESMDAIVGNANGSTFPEISKSNFRPLRVVVPSDPVLTSFTRSAVSLYRQLAENERESRSLAQLRDTLLPKLISGELRVPDAERIVGAAV
jgi:type I restriction enzyme S subunit